MLKFKKFPKVYMVTSIDVVVFKYRKNFRREIGEIVRYLPHRKKNKKKQNFGPLSNYRYYADRVQNLPGLAQHLAHNVPNFI